MGVDGFDGLKPTRSKNSSSIGRGLPFSSDDIVVVGAEEFIDHDSAEADAVGSFRDSDIIDILVDSANSHRGEYDEINDDDDDDYDDDKLYDPSEFERFEKDETYRASLNRVRRQSKSDVKVRSGSVRSTGSCSSLPSSLPRLYGNYVTEDGSVRDSEGIERILKEVREECKKHRDSI